MNYRQQVAELVKKKREEQRLTIRELSELCENSGSGTLVRDISQLENSKINMGIDNLFLIFETLNIDLSKLYNQ